MGFAGKVAVITGAGSGIGKAAAMLLAAGGARIAAVDVSERSVRQAADEIAACGGEAMPLVCDISQVQQVEQAYRSIEQRWGRVDIVFANAGINGVWAPLEELAAEEWDRTMNVNLRGTFLTIKHAVAPLRKAGGGSVIVTSSVNGTRMFSTTGATAYAVTKAAQVALVKMIALELAEYRIRVNAICPGAIETHIDQSTQQRDIEKVKMPVEVPRGVVPRTGGQSGKPAQVARLVEFLASDASDHITGAVIFIDGAQSLLMG